MMELLFIRHGDAEAKASSDARRALTDRGQLQARTAAQWLAQSGWQPDRILVSPYLRAQQTSLPLRALWPDVPVVEESALLPDNSPAQLLDAVEQCHGDRCLLVGHNPLATDLLFFLTGGDRYCSMSTASMALLQAEVLAQGCAELSWLRHYPDYRVNAGA